jgi:hypothetical protein
LTGVVFVVLTVVGFAISNNSPNSDASGQKVIAFYEAHRSRARASDILVVLGFGFFLFFAGSLRSYLRRTPAAEELSALVLAGAVMLAVGAAIFGGLDWALADVPNKLDPAAAQALNVLNSNLFFPIAIGGAVFGIATGLAILRGAALPNWLGWVALVIGIVTLTPAAFPAFLAFLAWSLVASVLLYIRGGAAPQAPVATAPGDAGG